MSILSPARIIASCVLTLLMAGAATAQDSPESHIEAKLKQARPDLPIESVRPSVAPGLYEVQLTSGPMLYSTEDGDFFVLGDLFAVNIDGIVNLAEQQRDVARKELMASVPREEMIIFAPEGETLASVAVFTDVDCFYCQKLHNEVPALNAKGIEVRYLAYPRAGVGSESYRKIASAWCAKDPQKAITSLKARKEIPENVCPGNPVADQFMLGQKVGVQGTPAMVLETGEIVPGYMPADDLANRLGIN